jgi:hypothetical protein
LNETKGIEKKRENSADLLENKMMIQLGARLFITKVALPKFNAVSRGRMATTEKGGGAHVTFFISSSPFRFFFFFFSKYVTPPQIGANHHNFPRRAVVNCDWERNFVFSRRRR